MIKYMSFAILLTLAHTIAAQEDHPNNVVFILIDDLRYDTFGYMNHPFIETPHIDSLAHEGIHFSNAFVTTSLCSPARASFLTGQYMHRHGVIDNSTLVPEDTVTFPALLQGRGYQTAFIGKWHMGGSSDAPRPGFDHWVSFRGQGTYAPGNQKLNVNGDLVSRTKYMTDELSDYAEQWLRSRTDGKPFMLYLSHKGVHGLYDPAPRHRDHYRDKTYPMPETMADTEANYVGKPMWVKNQRNSWHGVDFPYHGRSGQSISQMYLHYCEMILSIDDSVGRVRQTLKEMGLEDDTLVIFTSDGGHLWGEHGLIDKRCAYEESMRIPLLCCCPGMNKGGEKVDSLVANIDIAPTIIELAGGEVPEGMDGVSLLSWLNDQPSPDSRTSLLYEYYWEPAFPMTPTTFALRDSRYKLIQYHGIWDVDELYDLESDPLETVNLIGDPAMKQRVDTMRSTLHQQLVDTDGLSLKLGRKRGNGSNLRRRDGSRPAHFPPSMMK